MTLYKQFYVFALVGVLIKWLCEMHGATIKIVTEKINPLNAELNPICHLQASLVAHHIIHVSRIRVKPDRRCTYDVTLRSVSVTILAVEKQLLLHNTTACICSHR